MKKYNVKLYSFDNEEINVSENLTIGINGGIFFNTDTNEILKKYNDFVIYINYLLDGNWYYKTLNEKEEEKLLLYLISNDFNISFNDKFLLNFLTYYLMTN